MTSFEDGCIDLSFWLSLEDVIKMDRTNNDDPIRLFYDQLILHIDKWSQKEPWNESFIAASMGIEYSVEFKTDTREMLQEDNGVERWILPKRVAKNLEVGKFRREEKENTIMFSCYEPYQNMDVSI